MSISSTIVELKNGTAERTRLWNYLPYLLGLIALLLFVFSCRPFWQSNDDVMMELIASGHGNPDSASPRLLLTNIAWGYLVYWFPHIGGIPSLTWMTYLPLALSYMALVYAFLRSDIDHTLAAILLLFIYAPTLILPQHSLVAGYLAVAAIVLACNSIGRGSLAGGYVAGALFLMSGLVRFDETALVSIVALPLCLKWGKSAWHSSLRRQWLWMVSITAAAFLGFLVVDYLTFSTGEWAEFGRTYKYMMQFTDFKAGAYFIRHAGALAGTGYSVEDLRLISHWFIVDPTTFSPDKLKPLLERLTLWDRVNTNLSLSHVALVHFMRAEFLVQLPLMAVVLLFHRSRWRYLGSVAMLGLMIVLLLLAGRAQVTRIYIPVCAVILMIGALEVRVRWRLASACASAAALAVVLPYLAETRLSNLRMQNQATRIHTATCNLPHDAFFIDWGGYYPFQLEYLPFEDPEKLCPFNYYSVDQDALAPYTLARLHAVTGGMDLMPALLSGQTFHFVAYKDEMLLLRSYLNDHYGVNLIIVPMPVTNDAFQIYTAGLKIPQ